MLPGEDVVLCDLGLHTGTNCSRCLGKKKGSQTIQRNCMLVVKIPLNSRKFSSLAPLSGSHLGQLPPRAFPSMGHAILEWVEDRAGLDPSVSQRRAGNRK